MGILSLFHIGFFLTDDGNSMIIRFSSFYETLKNGQIPVRFLHRLNFGFGYPVADFLYPLFMYIGVPIKALGFSFVDTVKIIIGLSFLSGTIFSFLWFKKLFNSRAAFIGAVTYSLFPYHLFDLYKRGSVGEILALGIVPLILWAIEKGKVPLVSLGYGLLITAHNSLALMFIPVLFVYQLISKKNLKVSILSLIPGIFVSAFFWFPALYDKQFTVFDSVKVSNYGSYFINLDGWILFGLIFVASFILSIPLLRKNNRRLIFFLVLSGMSVILATQISDVVWKVLPLQTLIQFPFRFLSLAVLSTSYLVAYLVFVYKGKLNNFFIIFVISIIFISSRQFLLPEKFENLPDGFYSTNPETTTVKAEYMPKWVKIIPLQMPDSPVEPKKNISLFSGNSNNMNFTVSSDKDTLVEVQKIYFPGWKASVDGQITQIKYENPKGLIQIPVDKGVHIIHVYFEEGRLRLISDLISLVAFLYLILWSVKGKNYIITKRNEKN